jgi:arylsulfatase A-like enzyme
MCDELGYHEPGFMGSKTLQTPNIDKMAAGGVVFWNLFAGGSVCASTRCSLLTGKHTGLCSVRPNGVETPLRADEETIASVLKARGYATGLGKLTALAEKAHEPAREGSFALDVLNERDRRSGRSHPAQEKATNPKDEK